MEGASPAAAASRSGAPSAAASSDQTALLRKAYRVAKHELLLREEELASEKAARARAEAESRTHLDRAAAVELELRRLTDEVRFRARDAAAVLEDAASGAAPVPLPPAALESAPSDEASSSYHRGTVWAAHRIPAARGSWLAFWVRPPNTARRPAPPPRLAPPGCPSS